MAQQSVQARVMIEPAKLPITEGKTHKQNGTNKQKTTTGKYYKQKKTKGSAVERSRILSWSWQKKSETKTKQKHFPEKQSANKKKWTSKDENASGERRSRGFSFDFFNNLVDCNYSTKYSITRVRRNPLVSLCEQCWKHLGQTHTHTRTHIQTFTLSPTHSQTDLKNMRPSVKRR